MNAKPVTQLQTLQQSVEGRTGLIISSVMTEGEMRRWLAAGLDRLYRDVFGGPPYNEKFTLDEVRDIFLDFMREKGRVFIAADGGRPVAFVASTPLRSAFNVAAAAGIAQPRGWSYFAEDGVAADYRRRGLSGLMKGLLLAACRADGDRDIVLRTAADNYPQISAVGKAGGVAREGVTQIVPRLQNDGSIRQERNAFYTFNSKAPYIRIIDSLVITRTAGGDVATIDGGMLPDARSDAGRCRLARLLRAACPALVRVDFEPSGAAGETVYQGRFYLAR